MKKAMLVMLIFVAILFGIVAGVKLFIKGKVDQYVKKLSTQVATVSAQSVTMSTWSKKLYVVGSTRAVKGVSVTTESSGMIESVTFKSGADVAKGKVLVTLDIKPQVAKLNELEAKAQFARITYERDKKQFHFGAVSREKLDSDESQFKSSADLVAEQKAVIAKKIIRAPFAGRLGISKVYPGEFLNPGDAIVTLQTLNPIYVDFFLPQKDLNDVRVGQLISMTVDLLPSHTFSGKITTINPIVNSDIRNVEVEATLSNPQKILLPGMFANVVVNTGQTKRFMTIPYNAIAFNPYGASVFVLSKTNQKYNNRTVWKAKQSFIDVGPRRGNQIAVLKGINEGDLIVTSGQLKLENNSLVTIKEANTPSGSSNSNQQAKQGSS